ncbi:MAG: sulfatase-like hydrolase/transferase [Bacteroidales bacterium]|nr:sulfatase-like hydrolase/transferase [Bacteroidales bacterium]
MKHTALALLPPALLGALSCSQKEQPRPNILLIVADDLGIGDLSCYGSETIRTPFLDSLASDGLLMRNAYATSSTSTPSRFAMFTGMYPWRNPEARILPGDAPLLIDTAMNTLPKMMQELGYATGAVGKWHLGMGYGKTDWNAPIVPSGNTVGFDYTNLIPATVDRVPTVYVENGLVVGLDPSDPIEVNYKENYPGEPTADTNPEMMTMRWLHGHRGTIVNGIPRIGYMKGGHSARWDDATMAEYFLGRIKDFMASHREEPFFLYYGLHQPHVPRVSGKAFEGASGLGCRGDVVVEADWCVSEAVSALDSLGILDNTIIIFTSDNGAVLQDGYDDGAEEAALAAGHDPDGGLRGGKYSMYDAGTHVPMIVYWRGHIRPAVSSARFCLMDLYASLGKILGGTVPEGLDSEAYPEVLMGKELTSGRDTLMIEAMGHLAMLAGKYAFIPAYSGANTNSTGIELGCNPYDTLWDLEEDPFQESDISASEPGKASALKGAFLRQAGALYREHMQTDPLE